MVNGRFAERKMRVLISKRVDSIEIEKESADPKADSNNSISIPTIVRLQLECNQLKFIVLASLKQLLSWRLVFAIYLVILFN